jgi:hypothetical protein
MHVRLEVQTGGRLTLHYELDDLIDLAIEANNKNAGIVTPAPVTKPKAPVRPTANNPKTPLGKPQAVPMGTEPEPIDDLRFSGE